MGKRRRDGVECEHCRSADRATTSEEGEQMYTPAETSQPLCFDLRSRENQRAAVSLRPEEWNSNTKPEGSGSSASAACSVLFGSC